MIGERERRQNAKDTLLANANFLFIESNGFDLLPVAMATIFGRWVVNWSGLLLLNIYQSI